MKKQLPLETKDTINFIFYVESAASLLGLPALCSTALELKKTSPLICCGVVFGSDDYCADIGATRTIDAEELLYARQYIVTVTKAFNLQSIDLVHIDFKGKLN